MSTKETHESVRGDSEANKAAFPSDATTNLWPPEYGLTKREYFAGLAMQGLLANPATMDSVAALAVDNADALLAALEARHDN